MSIKKKMTEVFHTVKKRDLKGELPIEDELFIDFLTAYYVGWQIRTEGQLKITPNYKLKEELPFTSMRGFTRNQISENYEGNEDEEFMESLLKASERTYANQYNNLNIKTKKAFERRQKINKSRNGLKAPIVLYEYQKEKNLIFVDENQLSEQELKVYKKHQETIGRLQKVQLKKVRLPHLIELSRYYENLVDSELSLSEGEKILHRYMIERSFRTEYYSAISRKLSLLEDLTLPIDFLDRRTVVFYLILNEKIPSFRMTKEFLTLVFDPEWRLVADFYEKYWWDAMFVNVLSTRKLLENSMLEFIQKDYFGVPYTTEDYEIFKSEYSLKHLKDFAKEATGERKVPNKFNQLKLEITQVYHPNSQ